MAAREQWWVLPVPGGLGRAGPSANALYKVVESPARPKGEVAGPFPTKAEAEAWISAKEKSPIVLPSPIRNPLSDLGKAAHWIGDFVLHLTDGAMWRSIGWLLLGAWLIIAGIYLWLRTSATYKDLQSAVLGTVKAL